MLQSLLARFRPSATFVCRSNPFPLASGPVNCLFLSSARWASSAQEGYASLKLKKHASQQQRLSQQQKRLPRRPDPHPSERQPNRSFERSSADRFMPKEITDKAQYAEIGEEDFQAMLNEQAAVPPKEPAEQVEDDAKRTINEFNRQLYTAFSQNQLSVAIDLFQSAKLGKIDVELNNVSYDLALICFGQSGDLQKMFELFEEMKLSGAEVSLKTYTIVIRYCVQWRDFERAEAVYAQLHESSLTPDAVTYSIMLSSFNKRRLYRDAVHMFESIPLRMKYLRFIAHGAMHAYGGLRDIPKVFEILNRTHPVQVTFDIALLFICRSGTLEDMIEVFNICKKLRIFPSMPGARRCINDLIKLKKYDMARVLYADHLKPNNVPVSIIAYTSLLSICTPQDIALARSYFEDVVQNKLEVDSAFVTSLMQVYAQAGAVKEIEEVFASFPKFGLAPDRSTYFCMLSAYTVARRPADVARTFDEELRNVPLPASAEYHIAVLGLSCFPEYYAKAQEIYQLLLTCTSYSGNFQQHRAAKQSASCGIMRAAGYAKKYDDACGYFQTYLQLHSHDFGKVLSADYGKNHRTSLPSQALACFIEASLLCGKYAEAINFFNEYAIQSDATLPALFPFVFCQHLWSHPDPKVQEFIRKFWREYFGFDEHSTPADYPPSRAVAPFADEFSFVLRQEQLERFHKFALQDLPALLGLPPVTKLAPK